MVIKGRGKEGSRGFVMIGRVGGRAGWPRNGRVCENLNAGKLQLTMHAYVAMQHKTVCAPGKEPLSFSLGQSASCSSHPGKV